MKPWQEQRLNESTVRNGAQALRHNKWVKRHRMPISKKSTQVIVVVISATVILAVAVAWFVHARSAAVADECIQNLVRIDSAKQRWAMETIAKTNAMPPSVRLGGDIARFHAVIESNAITNAVPTLEDIRVYLSGDMKMPRCPSGGTYTIGRVADAPTCSVPGHALK